MKKFVLLLLLISIFLFIRFYKIDQSLYFYNDMGRDLFILLQWLKTGRFPILGPQTSALPINQSPVYYYLLMPFYLLTGQSPYSALLMNTVIYILFFIFSLYITRQEKKLNIAVLLSFVLIIFHPQHIFQNRYVWNPSLLPPILILSLVCFLSKKDKYFLLSIFLACFAVSIHYSALILLISYFFSVILFRKKEIYKFIILTPIFLLILNITTVIQLSKRLIISGYFWKNNQVFQTGSTFLQKLNDYIHYVLGIDNFVFGFFFLLFIFLISVRYFLKSKKDTDKTSGFIFLSTSFLIFVIPFNLQAHYIFAITSSLFLFIALLNWKLKIPIILFLIFFYLQPSLINSYFRKAPRSYNDMNSCFQKFCSEFKPPVFVSVISELYPYHFGPEHRYLMLKNGCNIKEIEKEPKSADYMTVVLDSGSYSSKSVYYELDLFGKHRLIKNVSCQKNFRLILLKRKI